MRSVALIAAFASAALAGVAHADSPRESRYGPAPDRAPVPVNGQNPAYNGTTYGGRALGWSGKREEAPLGQNVNQVQPWWARNGAAPVQPQAVPAYQPQAVAAAPAPRALPQSIYDAPPPAAAPVQAAYAPQPQQAAMTGNSVRTYSVGRQFGMQPDPIPAAGPSRMVLIAPSASAPDDDDAKDGDAKKDKDGAQ